MKQELVAAVVERIKGGADKEAIYEELRAAGYSEDNIESVYQASVEQTKATIEPRPPEATTAIDNERIELPGYIDLISKSFRFVFTRVDILVAALVVGGFFGFSDVLNENPAALGFSEPFAFGLLVSLLVVAVGIAHFASVVYVTAHTTNKTGPKYTEGLSWASTNIGSIIWIGILTTLIVWTGFVLFIIPGIIMGVYLALSYMVFARTGTRGLSALLLSRHAVRGHWWAVWLRQLWVGLVFFFASLLGAIVTGLLVGIMEVIMEGSMEVAVRLSVNFISVVGGMLAIRALSLIYHALEPKLTQPEEALATAPRTKYTVLAWLGIVVIPVSFAIVFFFVIATLGSLLAM